MKTTKIMMSVNKSSAQLNCQEGWSEEGLSSPALEAFVKLCDMTSEQMPEGMRNSLANDQITNEIKLIYEQGNAKGN